MPNMQSHRIALRWVGLLFLSACLGLTTACGRSTNALVVVEQDEKRDTVLRSMAEADVLYLGERHDRIEDHAAQLEIIQAMHQKNKSIAIALEMFQRPFQAPLDQYIAGEIDETQMIEQTQYMQRWGFPWALYAPILRYARQHQIPVLALNTPSEISKKIARSGLESLAGDDLKFIPNPDEIDTSNTDYRNYVKQAFGGHGAHGNFNFDNFFAAQVTWDETMAERVSQYKKANPQTQMIVLAGQGHVIYGHGIPDRVQRRLGENLSQQIVLLNIFPPPQSEGIADILWNGSAAIPSTNP